MILNAHKVLFFLLILASVAQAQSIYPGDAVRVNDETISYQRFNGFYVEYRNSKGVAIGARGDQLGLLTQLRQEAMDLLIEQALVWQAAERAGIEVDSAEVDQNISDVRSIYDDDSQFVMKLQEEGFTKESFRRHIERMIAAKHYLDGLRLEALEVSDAEVERYYHDNERRLTLPEQVRVRHILLTWKPLGTQDDRAAIRNQMQPILERARSGDDFAALAEEFSDDYATRTTGGDTGFFQRGDMVPAFEKTAFAMQPGEISDPVETSFGVHIIRLAERNKSRLVPFDEVREQLREHVRQERMEAAVRDEIDQLRAAADITVLIPLASRD